MADVIDIAADQNETLLEANIQAVRNAAAKAPRPLALGVCAYCFETCCADKSFCDDECQAEYAEEQIEADRRKSVRGY